LFEKNFNSANVEQHYSGPALDVFVGDSHTILKTKTGYLSKGQNYYGQTARPQEDDESNEFKDATYLKSLKIEEIYVGGWHNYAKLTNGTFVGWGYDYGRLGGGTSNTHAIKPVPLKHHLLGMTKLVCGGWHTMGLTSSGRMYIWGIDAEGSLGQKQINVTLNEPTLLLDNIRMAFSGKRQLASFAVRNDGEVLVWGKNNK
jgi:alpha-tubulin suppressor-like RCC1 family protein